MSADAPLPPQRPSRARFTRLVQLAAALVVIFGVALLARTSIAEYLIADALRQTGFSDVSLNVTRLNAGGVIIENLAAESGALRVSRIEADFTPFGLLRGQLEALQIDKFHASLSWGEDGFKLGDFVLRRRSDEPLSLPGIQRLNVTDGALAIATPAAQLEAPFSLFAEAATNGWNSALKARLHGRGVNIAVDWTGVIAAVDPAQSAGQGTMQIDVDDFAVPGLTGRLDATGLVSLAAGGGAFALTINKPLALSFDAPPLGVQSLDALPWLVTIAPSASEAALVVTKKADQRSLQFDISATAQAGDGRLRFLVAGSGSQSAQGLPQFALSTGRAEVENFPAGRGTVSGFVNVSDLAGTLQSAQGRVEAVASLANVAFGETRLDQAQASLASAVRVENGTATLAMKTLQADVSRATIAGWTLAAPTRLGLAPEKIEQTVSFSLLSGLTANIALSLPALSFHNKDGATVRAEAPDITFSAKGLDIALSARRVAVSHPAGEIREGMFDATSESGKLSGKSTLQLVRLGPAAEDDRPQTGALTMAAALTTRGDNLDLSGFFTAASGAKLGDFSARIGRTSGRGTAVLSVPKKRFERGGKLDSADLGFITAVSDLTGTIGLEAKATWDGDGRTETALATFEDVGFALGDVSVAGLSTIIDLTGLTPLRSAKPHHVTVQSIAAGLPLTSLSADVAFTGDETAKISHGTIDVAGGQITLADASIPLDERDAAFALGVQKVDMAQLSALAKVDGLSVTGTLSGTLPLRRDKTGFYFAEGSLRADGPGRLVYKPASPPDALAQNQGGSLLLQALSNFAYDRLSIALNGPVTEDISLGVSLAGRNPDLYGGYPIEFNLNLSGRLTQILKQGLVGYGIPADIERQLREGQKTPGR
jgi:hypothetical protein